MTLQLGLCYEGGGRGDPASITADKGVGRHGEGCAPAGNERKDEIEHEFLPLEMGKAQVEVRELSKLALESFEEAVEISKSHRGSSGNEGNEARGAAKASLRLALYCDELLKSPDDSKSEYIRDLGLEPSLVRHALLALAGGASGVPRARHLIPRVLALLRGGSDAYGQTVRRGW